MRLNNFLLLFVINLILVLNVNAQNTNLCAEQEKVFFSCLTMNKKLLSLCGEENNSYSGYSIFYKYGLPAKIELSYPSKNEVDSNSLTYARYHRFQTEYLRINFENYGYLYTVYRDYRGEESDKYEAGVTVTNLSTSRINDIRCIAIYENEMQDVRDFLPLNDDPSF